jgi:hypothetical protein
MRFLLCALAAFVSLAIPLPAQLAPVWAPPEILQIYRDPVKPGKLADYTKLENEAAHACSRANTWPYLTLQSVTGPQEVWFISGFDSYAAMEKSAEPFVRNAALAADLGRLMENKSSLVSDPQTVFLRYRDDLSRNVGMMRPHTRFFAVTMATVHPGHEREYEESQRILRAARERSGAADDRVVYQVLSGMPGNIYLTLAPYRSFREAGEALDGLLDYDDLDDGARNRIHELYALGVDSSQTFIFAVSPPMSNPAGEWIADDPDFWKNSPPLQRQAGARK